MSRIITFLIAGSALAASPFLHRILVNVNEYFMSTQKR